MSRLSWRNAADTVKRHDEKGEETTAQIAYAAQAHDGPYALCVLGCEWAVVHMSKGETGARKGSSGVAADHMAARARAEAVAAELREMYAPKFKTAA
jgi:hypothetical protein